MTDLPGGAVISVIYTTSWVMSLLHIYTNLWDSVGDVHVCVSASCKYLYLL